MQLLEKIPREKNHSIKGNHAEREDIIPPVIIFGMLMYRDDYLRDAIRFDGFDHMIEEIRKLESGLNEWCKVCLLILVVVLISVLSGFCVEWI